MAEDTPLSPEQNPLLRRLGLRTGMSVAVVAAPEGDDHPLRPLPEGAIEVGQVEDLSATSEPLDHIYLFARNRAELTRQLVPLRERLAPGGSLWVSWIRQSSGRRGTGLPGDLNENVIRRLALTHGLVDVKVASLNGEWAAIRLVHRRH